MKHLSVVCHDRRGRCALVLGAAVLLAMFCGCPASGPPVAPVKGKVVYEGKAVEGGMINFRPVAVAGAEKGLLGKPAQGQVQPDGTFVLTTNKPSDGAVIGKHEVTFVPAFTGGEEYDPNKVDYEKAKSATSPYMGLVPKEKQVEVKAGQNEFTIELVKGI